MRRPPIAAEAKVADELGNLPKASQERMAKNSPTRATASWVASWPEQAPSSFLWQDCKQVIAADLPATSPPPVNLKAHDQMFTGLRYQ
jgi:hypothetical protein